MLRRKRLLILLIVGPALIWSLIAMFGVTSVGIGVYLLQRANSVTLASLSGKVIILDPGHGGVDPGMVGYSGSLEKQIVLEISLRLRELLVASGSRVILTRETDTDLSGMPGAGQVRERKKRDLARRVEIGNTSGADIFISIHANGIPYSAVSGAQTFYNHRKLPDSKRLAVTIQKELVRLTGRTTREASHHIRQYILERLEIPACTVEVGFLSNPEEERLLMDPDYQKQMAWAIFVGIARYFAEGALPASKEIK